MINGLLYLNPKRNLGLGKFLRRQEGVLRGRERKRIDDAEIDAAFSRMGQDATYLRMSEQISRDFAQSDWEALRISEGDLAQQQQKEHK